MCGLKMSRRASRGRNRLRSDQWCYVLCTLCRRKHSILPYYQRYHLCFAASAYTLNMLRCISYVSPCESVPSVLPEVSTMFCRVRVDMRYYQRYQLCCAVPEYTFNTIRCISYVSPCQGILQYYQWYQLCFAVSGYTYDTTRGINYVSLCLGVH